MNAGVFGNWEGNWLRRNTGHDGTLPFLMYATGENASGQFDSLSPDTFKDTISAREIA